MIYNYNKKQKAAIQPEIDSIMSDYENALAPIELLYSRYPNNHNILEKYLIVLDKIESYEKIKEVTEGIDLKSIKDFLREKCLRQF